LNILLEIYHNPSFDNKSYWQKRYTEHPELGSGMGSRGEFAEYKQKLIKSVLDWYQPKSILDVGCGDMKVLEGLNLSNYTGIDISDNIVSKNREKFPTLNFLSGDFLQISQQFQSLWDLVLCFDVLIHQHNYKDYDNFVKALVDSTDKMGMIGAYENTPDRDHRSEITAYHEPITDTLSKHSINDIRIVSTLNQVSFLLFFK